MKRLKNLLLKRALELDCCNLGYNNMYYAETKEDILNVFKSHASWCRKNKILSDSESIRHFGVPFNELLRNL